MFPSQQLIQYSLCASTSESYTLLFHYVTRLSAYIKHSTPSIQHSPRLEPHQLQSTSAISKYILPDRTPPQPNTPTTQQPNPPNPSQPPRMCQLCSIPTLASSVRWPKPLESSITDLDFLVEYAHDQHKTWCSTLQASDNVPPPQALWRSSAHSQRQSHLWSASGCSGGRARPRCSSGSRRTLT